MQTRRQMPLILGLILLSACTRTLVMPSAESLSSPVGETIDVLPVTDQRASWRLGKLDTLAIQSGPDLVEYVEAELANGLARMGLMARPVDPSEPASASKRLQVSLLGAALSSESTLTMPVVATVRLRAELTDESGQSIFRKVLRGALSRDLGFHRQGGVEDAALLAEAIDQAVASLATDRSFLAAVSRSQEGSGELAAEQVRIEAERSASSFESPIDDRAKEVSERLGTLDQLLEEGLIGEDDYKRKRREILGDL